MNLLVNVVTVIALGALLLGAPNLALVLLLALIARFLAIIGEAFILSPLTRPWGEQ